jgi:hypothetical protein
MRAIAPDSKAINDDAAATAFPNGLCRNNHRFLPTMGHDAAGPVQQGAAILGKSATLWRA